MLGSLTIQVQMTWNFSHTYIPVWSIRSQSYKPKKLKQRRYDQKTRSDTEFSKALNSHNTSPNDMKFLTHIFLYDL
jgi:hypothetical protein